MTTYSELVDQIRSYTETSSDVLTTTVVNDFINQAELRIFREIDLCICTLYMYIYIRGYIIYNNTRRIIYIYIYIHKRR